MTWHKVPFVFYFDFKIRSLFAEINVIFGLVHRHSRFLLIFQLVVSSVFIPKFCVFNFYNIINISLPNLIFMLKPALNQREAPAVSFIIRAKQASHYKTGDYSSIPILSVCHSVKLQGPSFRDIYSKIYKHTPTNLLPTIFFVFSKTNSSFFKKWL